MSDSFDPPPPQSPGFGGAAVAGTPAEFGPRAIAYIIDILMGFALFIAIFVFGQVVGLISGILGAIVTTLGLLAAFLVWIYIIVMGMAVDGQTPGKRLQGIKVVQDSGEQLGIGGAVIRLFVQGLSNSIVCGLPLGGLSMLADSETKKTIYDKILNNQAIQVEEGSITPIFPGGKPF